MLSILLLYDVNAFAETDGFVKTLFDALHSKSYMQTSKSADSRNDVSGLFSAEEDSNM